MIANVMIYGVDVDLLREQTNFLLEYAWREKGFPEEIEGILGLLEHILDEAEVPKNQLSLF